MRTYLALAGGIATVVGAALFLGNLPTGAVAGLASCGSAGVCPSMAYSLQSYRLNGTVSGTQSPGYQINSISVESGPALCVAATLVNCTTIPAVITQTATGFGGAFSYAYPIKGTFYLDLQISYRTAAPTNVSSYSFFGPSFVLAVPSVVSGSCSANCPTVQAGFSWQTSGLVANFSDRSAVSGAKASSTGNATLGLGSPAWNFGDGTPTLANSSPSHLYGRSGTYVVTEYLAASGGSSGTISSQVTHTITVVAPTPGRFPATTSSGATTTASSPPPPVSPNAVLGGGILTGGAVLLVGQFVPWPGRGNLWSVLPAAAVGLVGYGVLVWAAGAMLL